MAPNVCADRQRYAISRLQCEFAAEQLLIAGWRSELQMWDTDLRGAFVEAEGVLTKSDIKRIEREAFRGANA
jgi:hypothetical protein